jgi:hypothetical protein
MNRRVTGVTTRNTEYIQCGGRAILAVPRSSSRWAGRHNDETCLNLKTATAGQKEEALPLLQNREALSQRQQQQVTKRGRVKNRILTKCEPIRDKETDERVRESTCVQCTFRYMGSPQSANIVLCWPPFLLLSSLISLHWSTVHSSATGFSP